MSDYFVHEALRFGFTLLALVLAAVVLVVARLLFVRVRHARPSVRALEREIVAWQRATFPHGTPASVAAHLLEEARELAAEPTKAEEMADVVILAIGVADRAGVDLWEAVRAKFEMNTKRRWGAVEANGVVHHVKPQAGEVWISPAIYAEALEEHLAVAKKALGEIVNLSTDGTAEGDIAHEAHLIASHALRRLTPGADRDG